MPAPSKPEIREGVLHPGLLRAIRVFALIGLAVSAYLAWNAFRGGHAIGCGPDSGCDRVLHSRWAYWFGVPVSIFALATYLVVLGICPQLQPKVPVRAQRLAWSILVPTALLLLGAAIWFVSLQFFWIKSICIYCLTAHSAGLITGVLILMAAPWRKAPDKPWQLQKHVFVPARMMSRMFIVAFGGLAVLIAGQITHKPRTSRETKQADILAHAPPVTPATTPTNTATNLPPVTLPATATKGEVDVVTPTPTPPPAPAPPTPPPATPPLAPNPPKPNPAIAVNGVLPVYEGRFGLEVNQVPVIGSPTNRYVVVSLFDYTCHHCRAMHPLLVEAQRAYRDQLVILSLPMPLDPECNQTMTRPHPDHTNACAYARLGLQVWRADRAKHHEFEEYMFAGEKPPPLNEALARARQLIGTEAFDRTTVDPWIITQLKLNVAIYELAYRSGQGSMPQLIVGSTVAVGTYPQPELLKLFADKLGLKPQP